MNVKVKGFSVFVYTLEQTRKFGLKDDSVWYLSMDWSSGDTAPTTLVASNRPDFRELAIIAGYDENKIDWAVPQEFFDAHVKEYCEGDGYCWYYGGENKIMGEPLSKSQIKREAARVILAEFYRQAIPVPEV